MQFTLTPRMVVLAIACFVLLGVLLFLAGMEIGQKMAGQSITMNAPDKPKVLSAVKAPPLPKMPPVGDLVAPMVPAKP